MRAQATRRLLCVAVLLGFVAGLLGARPCTAAQNESDAVHRLTDVAQIAERLDAVIESIPPISVETKLRRSLAHATFCLPQNVLGILCYGLLQATGQVVYAEEMNEMTIVVIETLIGASLGRYIFVPASFLTEAVVRHEYGHAMQGYRHGPFYLLLEGVTSFAQAVLSMVSPAFAEGYFDRWPENEASELGGVS